MNAKIPFNQKWIVLFSSLILVFVSSCLAELDFSGIQTLKARVSSLGDDGLVVAVFCLPCEQCKALVPEVNAAHEALLPWSSTQIILINCEEEEREGEVEDHEASDETCSSSYGVTSYPTIRFFRGSQTQARYRGRFRASSIITEILKTTLPPGAQADKQTFNTLKGLDLPLLLVAESKAESQSQPSLPSFDAVISQVAATLHSNEFFVLRTSDLSLTGELGAQLQSPFILVLNALDEATPVYEGKYEVGAILSFAKKTAGPLISRLDFNAYVQLTQSNSPLAFLLASTQSERTALATLLWPLALKYKHRLNFVTVDTEKLPFLLEPLGVDAVKLPAFAIHAGDNEDVYVYDQKRKVNAHDVEFFIRRSLKLDETPGGKEL